MTEVEFFMIAIAIVVAVIGVISVANLIRQIEIYKMLKQLAEQDSSIIKDIQRLTKAEGKLWEGLSDLAKQVGRLL